MAKVTTLSSAARTLSAGGPLREHDDRDAAARVAARERVRRLLEWHPCLRQLGLRRTRCLSDLRGGHGQYLSQFNESGVSTARCGRSGDAALPCVSATP